MINQSDMTINESQDEIIEEFADLTDWMDRYAYIIELGDTLPPYPDADTTPQHLAATTTDASILTLTPTR